MRTPGDEGIYTFEGDSLTVRDSGDYPNGILLKGTGPTGSVTIDNLILDNGLISHAQGTADIMTIGGNINIASDSRIYPKQGPIILTAALSGTATLTNPGADNSASILTLSSPLNTFTGDIVLEAAVNPALITLASNAVMNLVIGASGVNNSISGSGVAIYDGIFRFDLSGASTTVGDSWTISSVTSTYGSNFVVDTTSAATIIENPNASWFIDDATGSGGKFIFDGNSGTLSVVTDNSIPISTADLSPADGTVTDNSQPNVSITLIDGMPATVNAGTIAMTINGASVSPIVTPSGSGTNVVSYMPTLTDPGNVAVQVTYQDNGAVSYTNSWSFMFKEPPAATAVNLWNVNFAGLEGSTLRPVSDGSVVRAPSTGSNLWFNVAATNQTDPAGSNTSVTNTFAGVTDAGGANAIQVETRGSQRWGESIGDSSEYTVELFQGWAGANANCDYDVELAGLDSTATYDLYVYSTWRWTVNDTVYYIAEGTTAITNGVVTHNQANVTTPYEATDYSGLAEGENYIVFTKITPTEDGRIVFHVGNSVDTVCNGFQLVERPASGPSYPPSISSITVAGGMVTINWDSDTAGTYEVQSKTGLSETTWNPVSGATGLPGGDGNSTSFSVSGDAAEFFRIQGQ